VTQRFNLNVNGARHEVSCDPERSLLDVLREDMGLTGTKRGCGIGACGSCTVLVDGKPKRACRIKISELGTRNSVPGSSKPSPGYRVPSPEESSIKIPTIVTIEGLAKGEALHPIQQAFIDCGAIQCGFCTPGMVLAAKALLDENPSPTRDEIKAALRGNLCRCTGYQQIFEAVEEAAKRLR
jgi:carbon-monoxide dehydrogenase small subunit